MSLSVSPTACYFPSRQALLDALVIDGFTSLTQALRTAYERAGTRPPGEQWLAVCRAHRAWALDHQAEYLLLYGHDGASAVKQGNPEVDQAYSSAVSVLFSIMRGAVAAGEIDTERIEAGIPASLRGQFGAWRDEDDGSGHLSDGALAACIITYAQLHGAIALELIGHLPLALADHGALFDLEMVHAYAALCRPSFT
jgi:AcrR family transcriptional regulator